MFRFTLRDLFWATLVVAMGLGWWLHVSRLESELASTQSDLLYQADVVDSFVNLFTKLDCEIPPDSDPRCAAGGPYTRIFYSEKIQSGFGMVSSTLSVPRDQLQRTLDSEFGVRFRASPSVRAARAAATSGP